MVAWYTAADVTRFRRGWAAGKTEADMLPDFPGRTLKALRKFRRRLGIDPRPRSGIWSADEAETFDRLWLADATMAQMMRALPGRTRKAIAERRRRRKLPPRQGYQAGQSAGPRPKLPAVVQPTRLAA